MHGLEFVGFFFLLSSFQSLLLFLREEEYSRLFAKYHSIRRWRDVHTLAKFKTSLIDTLKRKLYRFLLIYLCIKEYCINSSIRSIDSILYIYRYRFSRSDDNVSRS
jgi:hypothetical protein